VPAIQAAIGTWLDTGQVIANVTGPWDQPSFPPLGVGHAAGNYAVAACVALGLGTLLERSALLFTTVKLAGARARSR
jgi:hypothetical protein